MREAIERAITRGPILRAITRGRLLRAITRDPIECPHCGEATVPNERADGSVVCSCAAARDLPRQPPGGRATVR